MFIFMYFAFSIFVINTGSTDGQSVQLQKKIFNLVERQVIEKVLWWTIFVFAVRKAIYQLQLEHDNITEKEMFKQEPVL